MQGFSHQNWKLCMTLSDILKHLIKFVVYGVRRIYITLAQTNSINQFIQSSMYVQFYYMHIRITWHTPPIISCLNSILLENIILKHFISPLGLICILLLHSLRFELVLGYTPTNQTHNIFILNFQYSSTD